MKVNKSKFVFYSLCLLMFLLMLLCNFLTGKYSDDFAYCYSFATKQRITNIFEIFPSICAHGNIMNGRAIAHFFAQLFLLLPPPVFKIINSAVFVLQILLIYTVCKPKDGHNNLLFASIFGAIWCFEPSFGQVNLWLDGSCNYLWSIVAGFIFLLPLINKFMYGKPEKSIINRIFFIIMGFVAGAYLENASASVIFMAVLLICGIKFFKKYKTEPHHIIGVISSVIGYITMMSAPGTAKNKAAEMSLQAIRVNFITALEMLNRFRPLLIVLAVLFVIAVSVKTDINKIILSAIFAAGALCANFILTFASYYPERCAFCVAVLLTAAAAHLVSDLFAGKYNTALTCLMVSLLLITGYNVLIGVNDIYATEKQRIANVEYISECKANGILDIEIPLVSATTRYSPAYDIKYLDTQDASTWPNYSMARYYEINSVTGR